jgi:hypothetical protein
MGCQGGIRGYYGVFSLYFVPETAQVELESGRVLSPLVEAKLIRSLRSITEDKQPVVAYQITEAE